MNEKYVSLNLPAVPSVAIKIMQLIEDPNVSLKQMESLISADQALTARILKIANSAFYGLRSKVTLISEAINIMGFKTLKDVVIIASLKEIYKVFGLIEKKLWEHGVGVSFVSSILADYITIVKKEEASLAGLMHDIGKIILNNNFPAEYAKCINIVHKENLSFAEVEKELFGLTHLEVGAMLADKWGFSYELKSVISQHNNLEYIKHCQDIHEKTLLLGINLADSICTRLGIGYKEPMPQLVRDEEEVMNILGIGSKIYSEIVNKFIDTFPEYLESFME